MRRSAHSTFGRARAAKQDPFQVPFTQVSVFKGEQRVRWVLPAFGNPYQLVHEAVARRMVDVSAGKRESEQRFDVPRIHVDVPSEFGLGVLNAVARTYPASGHICQSDAPGAGRVGCQAAAALPPADCFVTLDE